MRTSSRRTLTRRLLPAVLVVVALTPSPGRAAAPSGFVTRSGSGLAVNGRAWRAIGVNVWDLNPSKVIGQDITGCYYQHADLDSYFDKTFSKIRSETGATVVRTFGFRSMYTNGGRDWSATDKLLYYAQKYDIRLIPVFGDQYATCGAPVKDASWYRSGYRRTEQPWGISFRSYVIKAVRRYGASPTIAMWQLMNEAVSTDATALAAFSKDMVRAIRSDADDPYHLINLGTASGARPSFDRLLSCSTSGGCNDIGTAHVYDPVGGVPGAPLKSSVTASIEFWNSAGDRNQLGTITPQIEAWSPMKAGPQAPGGGRQYTNWAVRLSAPSSRSWTAYIDNITIVTQAGPQLYSFESGTEGFKSSQATLSSSSKQASSGASALRVAVPSGETAIRISGPAFAGAPSSVELSIRLGLRAPGKREGSGPAAMLHASVVGARKPFFLGELGYHAAVTGLTKCANYQALDARARAIDSFIGAQLDSERGASGVVLWDWKDPALQTTLPDGRTQPDPTLDCWSLTPGDPANAVVAKWAGTVAAAPLPAPTKRWNNRITQVVLRRPPSVIARGQAVPLSVRLTRGGEPMGNVKIRSSGCAGSGTTDALGNASFTCTSRSLGDITIRIRPDASACKCDVVSSFGARSKRAIVAAVIGSFVERKRALPITIAVGETNGSVKGIRWRIPECGISGTITSDKDVVTFTRSCATTSSAWRVGGRVLTFLIPETSTTAPVKQLFAGFAMERVYRDPAGECIGILPSLGWVAATTKPSCRSGAAKLTDSFVFQVPEAGRARAFVRNTESDSMLLAAEWRTGFRVDGRFDYGTSRRAFSAAITRSSRPAPATG